MAWNLNIGFTKLEKLTVKPGMEYTYNPSIWGVEGDLKNSKAA